MKCVFARADRSHTKSYRTEMSMRSNCPRNHWKTRFRNNVITLIDEIVAVVDQEDEDKNRFELLLCSCILTNVDVY